MTYRRILVTACLDALQTKPSLVHGPITIHDVNHILREVAEMAVSSDVSPAGDGHPEIEDLPHQEFAHYCRTAWVRLLERKASVKTQIDMAIYALAKNKDWDVAKVRKLLRKKGVKLALLDDADNQVLEDLRD
jgi:hypothetical protein